MPADAMNRRLDPDVLEEIIVDILRRKLGTYAGDLGGSDRQEIRTGGELELGFRDNMKLGLGEASHPGKTLDPPTHQRAVYTVNEFCTAHRISRSQLYKLWQAGVGPRIMRVGSKILITNEAAADWRSKREAASTQQQHGRA
jgi:hypothetical protein